MTIKTKSPWLNYLIITLIVVGVMSLVFNLIRGVVSFIIMLAIGVWGFQNIPANPPHVALVKFMGRYINRVDDAGYRFYWFRELIYSFDLINVEDVDEDFEPQEIIVPDRSTISIDAQVTFAPAFFMTDAEKAIYHLQPGDEKIYSPGAFLKNYIYKGGPKGVLGIFMGIYKARVREYFQKDNEGPSTWQEAIQSGETAVLAMMRSINGDKILGSKTKEFITIERNFNIPITSLYKYFMHRQPNIREKKLFGSKWEHLTYLLKNEDEDGLRDAFLELHENLEKLRQGEGGIIIPDLGIRIKRLTFPDIKPIGEVAIAAEKQAKEIQERLGEKEEMKFVFGEAARRAKQMVAVGVDSEIAYKQALETIMVERGKATKEIREYQLAVSGNAGQALENLATVLPHILEKLPSKGKASGGKK